MAELARTLMIMFKTRPDTYAEQRKDGSYMRVPHPLELSDVEAHLEGARTLGLYVIDSPAKDTCSFCAIDIDTRDEEIFDDIYRAMSCLAVARFAACEDSGNKGRHIFIFFSQAVNAADARKLLKAILKQAKAPHNIELFPKQDSIRADGFGSLIKLPLGIHKKSGRRSYFFANDVGYETLKLLLGHAGHVFSKPLDPLKYLSNVPCMSKQELERFVADNEALWKAPPLPSVPAMGKALKGTPPCIGKILEGVNEGARDSCLFNMCIFCLKFKKMSPSKALDAILEWNERNNPPLSQSLISWKVNYVASTDYDRLACRMDEMQEFCSDDCILKGRKR